MRWLGLLAVFAVLAPIGFHWWPRLGGGNGSMPHPEDSTSALLPLAVGRIFAFEQVDYYVSTKDAEEPPYIFHGIEVTLPISHIELWPEERALVAVTPGGERWEVGPRLREDFVARFRTRRSVEVIRTANGLSISGFRVPLVLSRREPSAGDRIAGFRQRYVLIPGILDYADCAHYGSLSDAGRAECDRVRVAEP
ncbi:MAG: hypothetical protein AAF657_03290 [Acidobacteriota bacterium]